MPTMEEVVARHRAQFGSRGGHLETEPGWFDLIDRMMSEIEAIRADEHAFQWLQIKEKFGTLRAYFACDREVDGLAARYSDIVDKYEKESVTVCEYCGQPGELDTSSHWIKVRCEECKAAKRAADLRSQAMWTARVVVDLSIKENRRMAADEVIEESPRLPRWMKRSDLVDAVRQILDGEFTPETATKVDADRIALYNALPAVTG